MGNYRKFTLPALVFAVFVMVAIPISRYILSLPVSQIMNEGCSGFSSYQLTNCIAYYQRLGDIAILQWYAQMALWILWAGLFAGAACSFYLFPRISLSSIWKVNFLFLGFLIALLIAGLPLLLSFELIMNAFLFAFSLIIGLFTLELTLVSSISQAISLEEKILFPGSFEL